MKTSKRSVGMNGFGRFGLNLLWWWFNDPKAPYDIRYINDEVLTPSDILRIVKTDPFVTGFKRGKVSLKGNTLSLQTPDGRTEHIVLTTGLPENAAWLGEPDMFFECSGKRTVSSKEACRPFLVRNTRVVIVSATAYDADATLVVGFNEGTFEEGKHRVVSYGSCTVNPGIVLASFLNKSFGVKGAVVGVVHNVQKYKLDAGEGHTLQRKFCTLETMGPRLLPFLTADNFRVNYTVVPWHGASMIDFAFSLKKRPTVESITTALKKAMAKRGPLEGLLDMVGADTGPETHVGSSYSAVFVEDATRVLGDTVHLFGYFYNEGSSIRMHELASHIARELR